MLRRKLGHLEVSLVGLGGSNFGFRIDEDSSRAVIQAALDVGVTLFDTADSYGGSKSEEILGRALGTHRSEVVITTKYGAPNGDREHWGPSIRWIVQAAEDSLRRLGTDYIDVYQQHFPPGPVPTTPSRTLARPIGVPIEESLEALDRLVEAGKVRAIGNSNFSGEQITEAVAVADGGGHNRFVSAQNELSLLRRGALHDVMPACQRHGLAFLPYFPLAAGVLTGKYRRGEPPEPGTRLAGQPARQEELLTRETFELLAGLKSFAEERGHSLLELAYAWLLAQDPVCSVISGATRPEQVRANVAAAGWRLTEADMDQLDRLLDATPV